MSTSGAIEPSLWDPQRWEADHAVVEEFSRLAERVLDQKRKGIGVEPVQKTESEIRYINRILVALQRGNKLALQTKITARLPDLPEVAANEIFAVDVQQWKSPASAALYVAAQLAVHIGFNDPSANETSINSIIFSQLGSALEGIVRAYESSGCVLPPGESLHFGRASMQKHSDELGSDLAIIVGLDVHGVRRFRVVLFQAKNEKSRSRNVAYVGHNSGAQLERFRFNLGHSRPL